MEKPSYIRLSAIEGDWFLNLKCTLALALALSFSLSDRKRKIEDCVC